MIQPRTPGIKARKTRENISRCNSSLPDWRIISAMPWADDGQQGHWVKVYKTALKLEITQQDNAMAKKGDHCHCCRKTRKWPGPQGKGGCQCCLGLKRPAIWPPEETKLILQKLSEWQQAQMLVLQFVWKYAERMQQKKNCYSPHGQWPRITLHTQGHFCPPGLLGHGVFWSPDISSHQVFKLLSDQATTQTQIAPRRTQKCTIIL